MKKTLTCVDCRVAFTYDHRKGPTRQRCDTCTEARRLLTTAAKSRRWRDAHPDRARESNRKHHEKRKAAPGWREYKNEAEIRRKYGLTMADFDALLTKQNGVCAICRGVPNGPGKRFHIDHCHNSLKVRGLLCGKCNTAIGLLNDDPERAESAAAYLRR